MLKHFPRILFFSIITIALILSACSQQTITTPNSTSQQNSTPEPTATEDFVPVIPKNAQELVLLSLEENGYSHLFAYIPGEMPLTRLTNGDWDDIAPAAKPDGKFIAFASNRFGQWDLYLMELATGDLTRLTDTPEYEGAPAWSPDGTFLAYEAYQDENLEIFIGPADNPANETIRLTSSPKADHSPAWSPGGRQIAFISNGDVILADLDRTSDARFTNLSNTADAAESHPVWSPDGRHLAWSSLAQNIGRSGIYIWNAEENHPAQWIGDGDYPAWNAYGDQIMTIVRAPNTSFITTYDIDGTPVQALTPFPYQVDGLIWGNFVMPDPLPKEMVQASEFTPAPLWSASGDPVSEGVAGRWSLVDLNNVQAPNPKLHDLADEAFNALRQRVIEELGWDALASLENAFVPITSNLDPGYADDWLYTGRAFAINSLMTNAGWMIAVREDFGAQTYWRLYLRAQRQDGSLGIPLHDLPWDLGARYNLDPKVYEQGGTYSDVPSGYWVDITSLALQYGWERVPALPNWRTYYNGARFTEFALKEGLDWYSAMLQLYPPDVLLTPTRVLPPTLTPTNTATPTPTPTFTRTPRDTGTPTGTRPPTDTPTITPSPTLTPTPPTIIP